MFGGSRRSESEKRGVWRQVPRVLATRNGWRVITTREVDVSKGDLAQPNFRSCLSVAQEGLFPTAPPLEAPQLLASDAATLIGKEQQLVMVDDVARAFFTFRMKTCVCVELPTEA